MAWVKSGNIKGPKGDAASIAVGTTTTGSAGSNAAVTNSGSTSAAVFNFTIPTGSAGARGSLWTSASGAPSTAANAGDQYLDTVTGDVWQFN